MSKVNICGVPHEIKYCDDSFNAGEAHFGMIDYKKAEIKISTGMREEMETQTLMHEILHGLLLGIGRNDLTNDEQFVQALAVAMTGCLTIEKTL